MSLCVASSATGGNVDGGCCDFLENTSAGSDCGYHSFGNFSGGPPCCSEEEATSGAWYDGGGNCGVG